MAGDWIKVEHATLSKPEVLMAAELLDVSRREALGIFLDYWAWLDVNLRESCNGSVTHVYGKLFEEALQCPGLLAVLDAIGWAKYDPDLHTLTIIHHERHNGNTAKSRALTRDRVRKLRQETGNDSVTLDALPEKRREEKRNEDQTVVGELSVNTLRLAPLAENQLAPDHTSARRQTSSKADLRGTRLEPTAKLPEEWRQWAIECYPKLDYREVGSIWVEFRNYWSDVPGKSGLKLRWFQTWQNNVHRRMKA